MIQRIIAAVGKHVGTNKALACRQISIRIHEPAHKGIVVAGFEVVQPGLLVEVVASVPQGVHFRHRAGAAHGEAPGVVPILRGGEALRVYKAQHVALEVRDVVIQLCLGVGAGPVGHGIGLAALVVEELQLPAAIGLGHQLVPLPDVLVLHAVDRLAGAQAVRVVGVAHAQAPEVRGGGQPSAVHPGEGGVVPPEGGVAYGVVADGITVEGGEQVGPGLVLIAEGEGLVFVAPAQQIAAAVVAVEQAVGLPVPVPCLGEAVLLQKLPLRVVDPLGSLLEGAGSEAD